MSDVDFIVEKVLFKGGKRCGVPLEEVQNFKYLGVIISGQQLCSGRWSQDRSSNGSDGGAQKDTGQSTYPL